MVNVIAILRTFYIALAFIIGFGLTAAGVLSLMDVIQVSINGVSPLDRPLPFGFASHGYTPALGAIVLLSAFSALRRRWQALELTCWFLFGTGVTEALYLIWSLGWYSAVPETMAAAFVVLWVIFPVLGLLLATRIAPRDKPRADVPLPVAAQERIRLRNTLAGMAVLSYLLRVITIALTPGGISALAYFRGTSDADLMLGSALGLGAAILLLVGILRSRRDNDKLLTPVLASTAGLAFEGFLVALDLTSGLGARLELVYALQDAMAFAACCAALALSAQFSAVSSRFTPA
jgi:hypothetical protein